MKSKFNIKAKFLQEVLKRIMSVYGLDRVLFDEPELLFRIRSFSNLLF